jgi:hypothetical protein
LLLLRPLSRRAFGGLPGRLLGGARFLLRELLAERLEFLERLGFHGK